jgi:hypothetical protein
LIGEEVLERCGSLPVGSDGNSPEGLAKALALPLGMTPEETKQHLEPHLRDGHICPTAGPKGFRWAWASS